MSAARRIAVVGAECSGKTTLAQALAERLPAIWVPERLREFCEATGRTPRADEQAALIDAQLAREAQALASADAQGVAWIVCDSTPLVTALYSVRYFGDATLVEAAVAHQRGYALTLLAGIDLPWVADGFLRDGPGARSEFHDRLRLTLDARGLFHTPVSGAIDTRISAAIDAIGRI